MLTQSFESFRNILDKTYMQYQLRRYQKNAFNPHVEIEIDTAHYLVKTASSEGELSAALRLRYEIFLREGLNQTNTIRLDVDRYDSVCDHLIIIDKRSGAIVGTYRLISDLISDEFYSENEFNLDYFMIQPGRKLELGRACIHKNYRNGIVITLLWKGVMNYLQRTSSRFLFGCASVKTDSPAEILKIYQFIQRQSYWTNEFQTKVTPNYEIPYLFEEDPSVESCQPINDPLPPLLQAYIRAGAQIAGQPAYDKDFHCIDFLTILDTEKMAKKYDRKYRSV